jgi:hypothetical protein
MFSLATISIRYASKADANTRNDTQRTLQGRLEHENLVITISMARDEAMGSRLHRPLEPP